ALRDVELAETPYLALSYCWEADQKLKLNMENEKTLQLDDAFPEGLPQTIQDAVLLARLLGFSFLWVDVLCICQGRSEADQQDRAVQLGNMVGIYRESNLAVVAACGDSADAG
ncbi:hypothetical protein B0T24DRAFT_491685, partial [Lasiosphaeria ovina]